ncbi:MAG: bifunctional methylenetetrahydrofolate dehydrogenase/methenyltetrahydrofolate cyclohydrolase FolD [Bacteroides sp.]|nr:bifunctional methylenetetrahydrofolate dehydrogenase/methenyltetrahydrofolate cyclohydrolase FolD [Bacteroides sp.]MCM1085932.1 bifunctional methylenetetrahydrofolate dehydrogenase/methenyltetrahydrofolate cyclohydrolase FolD [Bacteroides sp.]
MKLIDGKTISETIKKEIAAEVASLIDKGYRAPHMAAILVGHDGASETYIASKEKNCRAVGMTSSLYRYEENISEKELLEVISFLNQDEEVDGFIVQLPLPKHIDVDRIIAAVDPAKDIDGFHPVNMGRLALGEDAFVPATPCGIMELLKRADIETSGKKCVVLGRSNIVGTPMALLMSRNNPHANATVTICHSKTKNLAEEARQADILVAALGKPGFVTADMVKDGAVVVDVGIHRIEDKTRQSGFRLLGDVDFDQVAPKCSAITPVPGGVGPMTIAALLMNTMKAYKNRVKIQ